jgi:hypothetical protein
MNPAVVLLAATMAAAPQALARLTGRHLSTAELLGRPVRGAFQRQMPEGKNEHSPVLLTARNRKLPKSQQNQGVEPR